MSEMQILKRIASVVLYSFKIVLGSAALFVAFVAAVRLTDGLAVLEIGCLALASLVLLVVTGNLRRPLYLLVIPAMVVPMLVFPPPASIFVVLLLWLGTPLSTAKVVQAYYKEQGK